MGPTRDFKSRRRGGAEETESEGDVTQQEVRSDAMSEYSTHSCWLPRWRNRPLASQEAGKDKEMDSLLKTSERSAAQRHVDFSPVKTVFDLCPMELFK